MAVVVGGMLLKILFDLLKPWPFAFLVDYVLRRQPMPSEIAALVEWLPGQSTTSNLIGWTVAATLLLFLFSWCAGLVTTLGNITLAQRTTYELAADVFAKLQQLSLHFHARNSVGDNMRRVTGDCAGIATLVGDALLPLVGAAASLAGIFCILWQIHWPLATLSLAVTPAMIWVFRRYSRPMADGSFQQQELEGRMYAIVEQTFSAIPIVQAFGRERLNQQWFARANQDALLATLALTRVQLWFKFGIGFAIAFGTAGMLWFGTQQTQRGNLSLGEILVFLSYLGSFYAPLESILYAGSTVQGAAGSARRVWEVLHRTADVSDSPNALAITSVRGQIDFRNVTFGYDRGRPVLKNISLKVSPGETVALMGATGAGKSTLAALVPRFFDPWEGQVLLDGRDIREVTLKSLRGQVAMVLQEAFLFPISIAENIRYGRPDASREQIIEAARAANAHEFIERLPASYDTVVGERGATLSGGERQRIAIARALLKDAPILILDEPTSALDAESEKAVLDALERLTGGRTTLLIAHRLSTALRANRIVVLQEGAISESGSHQELLARGGIYAGFYAAQRVTSTISSTNAETVRERPA
jgi:ATP-binding cassette, subfamily B, bacterial